LYGIDRTAVDAQLEIEGGRAGRSRSDAAQLCAGVDLLTAGHGNRRHIAIQRIVIAAVVEDDQVAEAGERVGVVDGAGMNRDDRGPFRRGYFDAVSCTRETAGELDVAYQRLREQLANSRAATAR
jgi:hypothetical protein